MVKAIVFDLFETLVTEADSPKVLSSEIARRLGVPSGSYRAIVSSIRKRRFRGEFPDFRDVLRHVMTTLDLPYEENTLNKISLEREAAKSACFTCISTDILSMLRALKNRGLKTAVISNASAEEIPGFYTSALFPLLNVALFSCKLGIVKPEPEIYQRACERLGTEPGECLYIGDGSSSELPGAAAAGLRPYCATWFTAKHGGVPVEGFPVLTSPLEVSALFENARV